MMRLLLIRHAAAEERSHEHWPDDRQRPLTTSGEEGFSRMLGVLGDRLDEPELLLTSGFVRAAETAALFHRRVGGTAPVRSAALEMRGPDAIVEVVREMCVSLDAATASNGESVEHPRRIAMVGHEPDLSEAASLLVAGRAVPTAFRLRKGAMIAMRFGDRDGIGTSTAIGTVDWMAYPGLFRSPEHSRR